MEKFIFLIIVFIASAIFADAKDYVLQYNDKTYAVVTMPDDTNVAQPKKKDTELKINTKNYSVAIPFTTIRRHFKPEKNFVEDSIPKATEIILENNSIEIKNSQSIVPNHIVNDKFVTIKSIPKDRPIEFDLNDYKPGIYWIMYDSQKSIKITF